MYQKEIHKKICEEIYLEGVRGLLLEFCLDINCEKPLMEKREIEDIQEFIRKWVNARFPEKIIKDKDQAASCS